MYHCAGYIKTSELHLLIYYGMMYIKHLPIAFEYIYISIAHLLIYSYVSLIKEMFNIPILYLPIYQFIIHDTIYCCHCCDCRSQKLRVHLRTVCVRYGHFTFNVGPFTQPHTQNRPRNILGRLCPRFCRIMANL